MNWNWSEAAEGRFWLFFALNSNSKWKEIGLRQPSADSNWFSIKFYLKINGNWSEAAQGRFWWILNYILIENEKILVWGIPEHILIDF